MTKRTRQASEALFAGKLFDDRGNRMSPSGRGRDPSAGVTTSRRRLCRATRAKRDRSLAFPLQLLKRSSLGPLANFPPTAPYRRPIFAT
jgi:hypothetical protein